MESYRKRDLLLQRISENNDQMLNKKQHESSTVMSEV